MASIISAGTTSGTSLNLTGDTSGVLQLASNNGTTAVTVDTSQNLQLAAAGAKILNSSGRPILQQSGSVLQVIQTTKTDTFSTNSNSGFVDVTGLSVTITPTSSASKIMVFAQISASNNTDSGQAFAFKLVGGNTAYVGTSAGNKDPCVFGVSGSGTVNLGSYSIVYLDSPATTSATTYKIQARVGQTANTCYVNRGSSENDNVDSPRGASSITVMEIAA